MEQNISKELEEVIETAVHALDNVININLYPLDYAEITSKKYRAIGLGVSGYHHLLAKKHINWESEEHLVYADQLFENINYFAIKASNELAKKKGKYAYFDGSDWDNGNYFTQRGYTTSRWNELKDSVHEYGMRNGYLLAVAPTASTSIIAGTTAGTDPVMKKFFYEEKNVPLGLPRQRLYKLPQRRLPLPPSSMLPTSTSLLSTKEAKRRRKSLRQSS